MHHKTNPLKTYIGQASKRMNFFNRSLVPYVEVGKAEQELKRVVHPKAEPHRKTFYERYGVLTYEEWKRI